MPQASLRAYFRNDYKGGGVFKHDAYEHDADEWCWIHKASRRGRRDLTHFVLPRCDAADSLQPLSSSSWQVWQDALDLTQSGGSGAVDCFFHYTTQLGFRNITAPQKKAVEVFVLHSVANQHVM